MVNVVLHEVPLYKPKLRGSLVRLIDLARLVGAEIGVHSGHNAEAMMLGLDMAHLYLIDPFLSYIDTSSRSARFQEGIAQLVVDSWKRDAEERLAVFGDKVEWLCETSDSAKSHIPIGSLDFVYIDGLHTFDQVLRDIFNYVIRLKPGGLLAGHDYKPRNGPSVVEAVDQVIRANSTRLHLTYTDDDCDWWIYVDDPLSFTVYPI